MTSLAFWTILVGIVCNTSCALLGCYLVLRRMSLLGDAISHGVLPGIALAFLFTGQVSGVPIFLGAMVFGVLTAFLAQTLATYGKVPEDASLGVVFSSLFALGVILISVFARQVDLDPNCVFYGLMEGIPLNTFSLLGLEIPNAIPTMLLALGLSLAFTVLFWKELKIVSFDPTLATAIGLHATLVHYLLMALVAGVTVASFEAVGSVVVIAMLIVPGACGHLLSDRLPGMMAWAVVVAVVSAILGYYLASDLVFNANVPGMMAVVAGLQFFLAVLFAPRHGILAKIVHNARLGLRIAAEDILATLYRREEAGELPILARENGFSGWRRRLAFWALRRKGLITMGPEVTLLLTEHGRHRARSLVRSHRLWEAFLDQNFNLPADHLHDPAERMEHFISPALQKELETELHKPDVDPHGKKIPPG